MQAQREHLNRDQGDVEVGVSMAPTAAAFLAPVLMQPPTSPGGKLASKPWRRGEARRALA